MSETTIKKLELLYLPFLFGTLSICLGYTFLNWLLIIKLQLLSVKQVFIDFVGPIAIYALFVLFYFRPRLRLLALKTKKGTWIDFYSFVLLVVLSIPIIIAQIYLDKAAGKLTNLESITSINKHEPTKYYTLKKFFFDKARIGFHTDFSVSGKHNQYFDMTIYVAVPLLQKESDTIKSKCEAWLGIKYTEQISNRLEPHEKETRYMSFAKQSQKDFEHRKMDQFVYLERIGNSEEGDGFKEAIKINRSYNSGNSPIFKAIDEPFENRFGKTLEWIFGSLGIGAVVWLIMILIPKINKRALKRFEDGKPIKSEGFKETLLFLKPAEGFFVTPVLIYINVAVYLAMFFSGLGFISFKGADLVDWGANFRPATADGEWWRLLTSVFLHGGLMHILANMYGLLFVGFFLEPLLGRFRYLIVYLLAGVLASCASLWWHEATVSVGASGAIFGLYGIFLAMLLTRVFSPEFAKSFLISTLIFVGINLAMGLAGGIDNAAHIGGLISGFIIGLILRIMLKVNNEIEQ